MTLDSCGALNTPAQGPFILMTSYLCEAGFGSCYVKISEEQMRRGTPLVVTGAFKMKSMMLSSIICVFSLPIATEYAQ